MEDLVVESLSKIKDSIIEAHRKKNSLLHQKLEKLESRISVLETDLNKQDQYNRRNNLDIQGIPDFVPDDQIEEKVIEIASQINVKINARTVIVWVSQRKGLLSALLIERTVRQFCKKS